MKMDTKKLVLASFLIALEIVLTRFIGVSINFFSRYSLQFLAHVLCGYFLGPLYAPITLAAADILGFFINPGGYAFFPGYTLSAAINGLIYGSLLYKKQVTFLRSIGAVMTSHLLVTLGLGSLWLSLMSGRQFWEVFVAKVPLSLPYGCVAALLSWAVLLRISSVRILKITD